MLVDKIIIERNPSKIDKDGRRHYLIRAIPHQDPRQEAERLSAVHKARVKSVPESERTINRFPAKKLWACGPCMSSTMREQSPKFGD
jgi:hypothetical protein